MSMSKRTVYTNITPLAPQVTRQMAVNELHDHGVMIRLNPLVIGFEKTTPHNKAPADEYHCIWYEITDKVSYLPGVKGEVKYKACFFDRPNGLQTHCYAPTGLDIKAKWVVGGNMPGEPREARELGVDTPRDGLYLREEVDMRCNIMMTSFVKKNLKNAHKVLVDRLLKKVEFVEEAHYQQSISSPSTSPMFSPPITPGGQPQQFLPHSSDFSLKDEADKYGGIPVTPLPGLPQQQYRHYSPNDDPAKFAGPPPHYWQASDQKGDWTTLQPLQRNSYPMPQPRPQATRSFAVELPGSEVVMPSEIYTPPLSSNLSASPKTPQEKEAGQAYGR